MKKKTKNNPSLKTYSLKEWAKIYGPYLFTQVAKHAFSNPSEAERAQGIEKKPQILKTGKSQGDSVEPSSEDITFHVNSGWNQLIQEF